jgi:hypothetical protein
VRLVYEISLELLKKKQSEQNIHGIDSQVQPLKKREEKKTSANKEKKRTPTPKD